MTSADVHWRPGRLPTPATKGKEPLDMRQYRLTLCPKAHARTNVGNPRSLSFVFLFSSSPSLIPVLILTSSSVSAAIYPTSSTLSVILLSNALYCCRLYPSATTMDHKTGSCERTLSLYRRQKSDTRRRRNNDLRCLLGEPWFTTALCLLFF